MTKIATLEEGSNQGKLSHARGHALERLSEDALRRAGHEDFRRNSISAGSEIDLTFITTLGHVPAITEIKNLAEPVSIGDLERFVGKYEQFVRPPDRPQNGNAAAIGLMVSLSGYTAQAREQHKWLKSKYPNFDLLDADDIYDLLLRTSAIASQETVIALVAEQTGLIADPPVLLYAIERYFWLVPLRGVNELVSRQFVITDPRGHLCHDVLVIHRLERLALEQVLPRGSLCINERFSASRRGLMQGQFKNTIDKSLRRVLKSKGKAGVETAAALEAFLHDCEQRITALSQGATWLTHARETEKTLDQMIPDEMKEQLSRPEMALLVATAWYHVLQDAHDLAEWSIKKPPDVPGGNSAGLGGLTWMGANGPQYAAALEQAVARLRGRFEPASKMRPPFDPSFKVIPIADERLRLDLVVACNMLACALNLAFKQKSPDLYGKVDPKHLDREAVVRHFNQGAWCFDYNRHRIQISADAENLDAHLALLRLVAWVQRIVDAVEIVLYDQHLGYQRVIEDIKSGDYELVGQHFEMHTESVLNLLMGREFYGTTSVALRELVQNAQDAVMTEAEMIGEGYRPEIWVRLYQRNGEHFLEIEDNGCGMDGYLIQRYFCAIGRSYWRSSDRRRAVDPKRARHPCIGQFGIGVLTAFMIGDEMQVDTKTDRSDALSITIPDVRDYFIIQRSSRPERGTRLTLRLVDPPDVHEALFKYIVLPAAPIHVADSILGKEYVISDCRADVWRRLGLPEDLSGAGELYGLPVSIRGEEFDGEIICLTPGDLAEIDSSDDALDYLLHRSTNDPRRAERSWRQRERRRGGVEQERHVILLQAGILVTESGDSSYNDGFGCLASAGSDRQSVRSDWVTSYRAYLNFRPGILNLTANRNDVVDGEIPFSCLEAIAQASKDILPGLRDRCDALWGQTPPPNDRHRTLINETLRRFSPGAFKDDPVWRKLVVERYSLLALRVQDKHADKLFLTALELESLLREIEAQAILIHIGRLERWWDVYVREEEGPVIYLVDASRYWGFGSERDHATPSLDYLSKAGLLGRNEQVESVTDGNEFEEVESALWELVRAYEGFYRIHRPTRLSSKFAVNWSGRSARKDFMKRADGAQQSRAEFKQSVQTHSQSMAKIMFGADDPRVKLAEAIVERADDRAREQVQRFFEAARAQIEERAGGMRKKLLGDLNKHLAEMRDLACELGLSAAASLASDLSEADLVIERPGSREGKSRRGEVYSGFPVDEQEDAYAPLSDDADAQLDLRQFLLPMPEMRSGCDTALLLVDVAAEHFTGARPVCDGGALAEKIAELLSRARAAGAAVFYILCGAGQEVANDTAEAANHIHPRLAPWPDESILYTEDDYDVWRQDPLQLNPIFYRFNRLVIAGIGTESGIDIICREAHNRGFDVTLVGDAHSTWDTELLSAPQVIAYHNALLNNRYVHVESAVDVEFTCQDIMPL